MGRRGAAAAVPEPSQPGMAVVDVTGYGLGVVVAAEIGDVGRRCAVADERAVSGSYGLVLVLPTAMDEVLPATKEVWFRLEHRARSGGTDRPPWIVPIWAVRRHERPVFATPHLGADDLDGDRRHSGANAALLVIGRGWERELHQHAGDVAAATACRSAVLRRALAADSHRYIAGANARDACADLDVLDPDIRHGVLVEVRIGEADLTRAWSGWAALRALVRTRLVTE